jgi:hypothetical protein
MRGTGSRERYAETKEKAAGDCNVAHDLKLAITVKINKRQ